MTSGRLAVLYLLFALPLATYLAWRVPPFQQADEDNHFLRAVQVAQGGIAAARLPDGVIGGLLPTGAEGLAHGFNDLRFRPRVTLDAGRLRTAADTPWGPAIESTFANTAIYPPIFYLPAAAAIGVARWSGLPVLAGLRMARLANATAAIGLAALSIALAQGGCLLLFWLLSLPMTLSLFASCSQDAMLIAAAALAGAAISRLSAGRHRSLTGWGLLALLLGCLGAARPPYLLLAPLPALWAKTGLPKAGLPKAGLPKAGLPEAGLPEAGLQKRGRQLTARARLGLLALPFLVGLGWLALGAAPVLVPNTAARQLQFLLGNASAIPHIASATIRQEGLPLLREFIGVLGWLDVSLPRRFYPLSVAVLAIVLVAEGPPRQPDLGRVAATMVLVLGCCAAIFAALYLDWTPVGAAVVDGVQGRYFIPLAVLAAPLFGRRRTYPRLLGLVLTLWLAAGLLATIVAVRSHYVLAADAAGESHALVGSIPRPKR